MQFLGSCSQSMSQRNLSHANQPIGGVLINPLSRAKVAPESTEANRSAAKCITARRERCLNLMPGSYAGWHQRWDVLSVHKVTAGLCEPSERQASLRHLSPPKCHLTGCDHKNLKDDYLRGQDTHYWATIKISRGQLTLRCTHTKATLSKTLQN